MRRTFRLTAAVAAVAVGVSASTGCGVKIDMARPVCGDSQLSTLSLIAQSVREASLVPCLEGSPTGWEFESMEVRNSGTEMGAPALIADLSNRTFREVEAPQSMVQWPRGTVR